MSGNWAAFSSYKPRLPGAQARPCRAGQGTGEKGIGSLSCQISWKWVPSDEEGELLPQAQRGSHRELLAIAPGAGPPLGTSKGRDGFVEPSQEQVAVEGPPWAPRGVAGAQLLGDATWATRGETRFSTLTPLIMRSYTGSYARNQPKHAGSCVQKIAVCHRSGQALQKVLGGEQPLTIDDCDGSNQ